MKKNYFAFLILSVLFVFFFSACTVDKKNIDTSQTSLEEHGQHSITTEQTQTIERKTSAKQYEHAPTKQSEKQTKKNSIEVKTERKTKETKKAVSTTNETRIGQTKTTDADNQKAIGKVNISINCIEALKNKDKAEPVDVSVLPKDGIILDRLAVEIKNGDSVFDVLKETCRKNNIQLDFVYTPMYSSYYVRGISQIYEKAFGSVSGWVYLVNGIEPNVGSSKYKLKANDVIEWRYICN